MILKNNTYKKLVIGSILINTVLISQTAHANEENAILDTDTKIIEYELNNVVEKEDTYIDENLEKDPKIDLEEIEYDSEEMEKLSLEPQEKAEEEVKSEQKYKKNIKSWANSFAGNAYYDDNDEKMASLNEKMDTNVENTLKLVAENNDNNFWTDIKNYDQSKIYYPVIQKDWGPC